MASCSLYFLSSFREIMDSWKEVKWSPLGWRQRSVTSVGNGEVHCVTRVMGKTSPESHPALKFFNNGKVSNLHARAHKSHSWFEPVMELARRYSSYRVASSLKGVCPLCSRNVKNRNFEVSSHGERSSVCQLDKKKESRPRFACFIAFLFLLRCLPADDTRIKKLGRLWDLHPFYPSLSWPSSSATLYFISSLSFFPLLTHLAWIEWST
jgi:hypothetical protein